MLSRTSIALILVATIMGCSQSPSPTPEVVPSVANSPTYVIIAIPSPTASMTVIPFRPIMSASIGGAYGISGPYATNTNPELFVIGNSGQLLQVWKAAVDTEFHGEQLPLQNPLSQVDFNESLVLAYFVGPRPNTAYRVEVSALRKSGVMIEMLVATAVPTPPLYPALSSPSVFIAIKKTDLPDQGHIIVKDVNGTTYVDRPIGQ